MFEASPAAARSQFFLESLVDAFTVLALRRLGENITVPLTDETHFPSLKVILDFLGAHFNAPIIINADTRDSVVQLVGSVLQLPEFVHAFESSHVRFALARLLLSSFDAHCWLPVTSMLLRLWRGTGFGDALLESTPASKTASVELQDVFVTVARESPDLRANFINQIFDNLNWVRAVFDVVCSGPRY